MATENDKIITLLVEVLKIIETFYEKKVENFPVMISRNFKRKEG